MTKALLNGILTGLFLQIAIGPIFFLILGITVESNFTNSFSAILAVTFVDYIYIILSLLGIGKLLQGDKVKKIFGMVSSLTLVLFGLIIFYKGLTFVNDANKFLNIIWTPVNSFTSCFILTISSPLTIVFWGSIFTVKAVENNYKKKQLIIFGLGAGLSTFIFLTLSMLILSLIKTNIPNLIVPILNCIVGLLLVYYGVSRALKTILKNG